MKHTLYAIHLFGCVITGPDYERVTFTRLTQAAFWEITIVYYELPKWFELNIDGPRHAALREEQSK